MSKNSKLGHGISCCVTSCRYNKNGCACDLETIEVAPIHGASSGRAEEESMCKSYHCKG